MDECLRDVLDTVAMDATLIQGVALLLLPPCVLLGTVVFVRHRSVASRILWTGLATLFSLPLGFVAFLVQVTIAFHIDHREPNPGQGVILIPLTWGWMASLAIWLIGMTSVLIFVGIR